MVMEGWGWRNVLQGEIRGMIRLAVKCQDKACRVLFVTPAYLKPCNCERSVRGKNVQRGLQCCRCRLVCWYQTQGLVKLPWRLVSAYVDFGQQWDDCRHQKGCPRMGYSIAGDSGWRHWTEMEIALQVKLSFEKDCLISSRWSSRGKDGVLYCVERRMF